MSKYYIVFLILILFGCKQKEIKIISTIEDFPALKSNNNEVDTLESVFHIAMGDIFSNLRIKSSPLHKEEETLLFAGLDYYGPWTRDASISCWNGVGLFLPEICMRTMISNLDTTKRGEYFITGQYWDKIIWSVGAWNLYLYTGNTDFLKISYNATINTLKELEKNEFDSSYFLFRGPAVYGDGIAAYPDIYTHTGKYEGGEWISTITKWVEANPDKKAKKGFGMPMFALSTNCIYYETYAILSKMEKELGIKENPIWNSNAEKMKIAINTHFWDKEKKRYNYLVDPFGGCQYQEGMGISYAILFGIADEEKSKLILENTHVSPYGIECVYPSFPRYKNGYGRHSGVIWSHIQGFWAHAASLYKNEKRFTTEFNAMTLFAWRDKQFREIYHPETGLSYGGLQETNNGKIEEWKSTERQTWSATAYLRMVFNGLFGMHINEKGITFDPFVPYEFENLRLFNIHYRKTILTIYIKGKGSEIKSCLINGKESTPFISSNSEGKYKIEIELI